MTLAHVGSPEDQLGAASAAAFTVQLPLRSKNSPCAVSLVEKRMEELKF